MGSINQIDAANKIGRGGFGSVTRFLYLPQHYNQTEKLGKYDI